LKVLITGGKGRLGTALAAQMQPKHTVTSMDVADLDVTDYAATQHAIARAAPDVVIHCAAWTDVDGCARDPERAMVINGMGAGNVAAAAHDAGASVVYISSNEVFDGERNTPYHEYDRPNPTNPYGTSKHIGEQETARFNPCHIIVRTSWLFAHGGKNFMQSIIGAAEANKPLRVVVDEVAHPTYTDDLAVGVAQLAEIGRPGVYHLVNSGAASRWQFARTVLNMAGFANTPIAQISRTEWPRPSKPPRNTHLANVNAAHLGVTLRPWQRAVEAFLQREGLLVREA